MIEVKVAGDMATMARVAEDLDGLRGVQHVVLSSAVHEGQAVVRADAGHGAVDALLERLAQLGVPAADVVLTRVEEIGLGVTREADSSLVWADVVGIAGSNARIIARYLVFMAVAGVIAAYGIVDASPILVVGAMAVSPDLLPITSTAVALVGGDLRLALRALLTLVAGLAMATLLATIVTALQNAAGVLPPHFNIDATILHSLTTVNDETVVVAFAAGIAGMLALETRASSGVGVAISVTTIPAAAYLGVALGLGELSEALSGLEVLGVNVLMLVVGASLTLALQRRIRRASAEA